MGETVTLAPQTDAVQDVGGVGIGTGGVYAELNVLCGSQAREQIERLEDEADCVGSEVEQLAPRRRSDVDAVDADRAVAG